MAQTIRRRFLLPRQVRDAPTMRGRGTNFPHDTIVRIAAKAIIAPPEKKGYCEYRSAQAETADQRAGEAYRQSRTGRRCPAPSRSFVLRASASPPQPSTTIA